MMERDGAADDFTLKADAPDTLEADRERVWRMLDLLPKGQAHPSLAVTTIEMSAVGAGAGRDPRMPPVRRWPRRSIAAVLLAASLAAGFVAGSRSRTVPDDPLAIAVVRHAAVLREAGSVDFLRMLANRDIPPPRRPGKPRTEGEEAEATEPYPELDRAVADFRAAVGLGSDASRPAPRRDEPSLQAIDGPVGEWKSLAATARTLASPGSEPLIEAARRWHQWVLASDPVERRILPTLGTKERLEWIARRSRPWRQPGARGPFPPPPGGGPPFRFPREVPRENRGPGG